MSSGTIPIVTCDHEDGCDVWAIDYTVGASVPKLPDDWRPIDDYYVLCPEHLSPARPFHGEGAMRKCTEAKDDGFTVHRCWEDVGHECDHRSLGGYTWPVSTSGEVKP